MGATEGLGDAALDGLSDLPDKMGKLGSQSASSLNTSLASGARDTRKIAAATVDHYVSMYGKKMDQHSPSKVMMRLGEYTVQGLIIGLSSLDNKVGETAKDTAEEGLYQMSKALSGITDLLTQEIDMNPVISPTIDLSNVALGAEAINNMLASDRTLSLAGNANFESSRAWARNNQNGLYVNNSDVVKALGDLRDDVTNLNNNMSKLQVVMDTGALVGQIIDPIDYSMGKRAMYRGRGV